MSARYVTICGQEYNKKQFGSKWTGIVNKHEIGVPIARKDRKFLLEVLRKIPKYSTLSDTVQFYVVCRVFNGKKVRGIEMKNRRSYWIGKQYVMKAIFPPTKAPDPSKENRRNALKALRGVIEPQIMEYRKRFSNKPVVKSSLSGKPIFGTYHVDHVYPFIRLVEEWCREKGYDLETIPVKCKGVTCRLKSVEMAESWFDYHSFHAEFQILDASENTSKGSRYFGREKPVE